MVKTKVSTIIGWSFIIIGIVIYALLALFTIMDDAPLLAYNLGFYFMVFLLPFLIVGVVILSFQNEKNVERARLRTKISFKKFNMGWITISIILLGSYILGELVVMLPVLSKYIPDACGGGYTIAGCIFFGGALLMGFLIAVLVLAVPAVILVSIIGLVFRHFIQNTEASDKVLISIVIITSLLMFAMGVYAWIKVFSFTPLG